MSDPSFNTTPVINPFGLTNAEYPIQNTKFTLADIDGDGDLDAFIGNSNGVTQFFRNTGATHAPSFVEETSNFGLSDVGTFATPSFVDIDNAGDLDAFVGNGNDTIQFFRNTGTPIEASFVSEAKNFGLSNFTVNPSFVDINGDGDFDTFIGGNKSTFFFLNNKQPTLSQFTAPVTTSEENSLIKLTFEQLLAMSNATDADGSITAFEVTNAV